MSKGWFQDLDELHSSMHWKVGDGKSALFWKDSWCGDGPFMYRFPDLYRIAEEKNCSVAHHWEAHEARAWRIRLTRAIREEETCQAAVLMGNLRAWELSTTEPDRVFWQFDPTRGYSARQGYRWFIRNEEYNTGLAALHVKKMNAALFYLDHNDEHKMSSRNAV
ncbi:hypothetical protein QJS10_CPB19g01600 [Acorus calamus]|uniref:Uncharacterized protein n=1 Tax=Acorus calamus TaxID=4465 RepID=A0AAV9CHI5_ACOCL|nr:hypothetical protein QJS10_CPB19g01600 [Acorus calamus]